MQKGSYGSRRQDTFRDWCFEKSRKYELERSLGLPSTDLTKEKKTNVLWQVCTFLKHAIPVFGLRKIVDGQTGLCRSP